MSRIYSYYYIFILLSLLSSCSSTHQAYLRTLKLAFDESQDIILQTNDISQSPVDLIYVKKGSFPTIVLALAFIENDEYKWISSDKASLIEQNGRIIKTLSLDHNLDFVTADVEDPLIHPLAIKDSATWQREIDFDGSHFGVQLDSVFSQKGSQVLAILEQNIEVVLIEERVRVIENNDHDFSESEWLNQFWLNKSSGRVIRSNQKITPNSDFVDITYISRALRL
ncbi:YjbF family lipoprotein [Paraglaciecola hydrolytica]|nr:YjbF family lipoprotein [Paraglaciecola hydrolytica]